MPLRVKRRFREVTRLNVVQIEFKGYKPLLAREVLQLVSIA